MEEDLVFRQDKQKFISVGFQKCYFNHISNIIYPWDVFVSFKVTYIL